MKKQDDKIVELVDADDEEEEVGYTDDFDRAFWKEFYKKERKDKEKGITVEERDDGVRIKVESKIPKIRTN